MTYAHCTTAKKWPCNLHAFSVSNLASATSGLIAAMAGQRSELRRATLGAGVITIGVLLMRLHHVFLLPCVLALAACQTTIKPDYDTSYDFSTSQTWQWAEPKVTFTPADDPRLSSDLTAERVKQAVADGLDARGLRPVLEGAQETIYPYVFGYFRDFQRMVRGKRWKLIHYPQIGQWQLFDLQEDPHELRNRVAEQAHQATVDQLRRELLRWQRSVSDPVIPQ